MIQILLALIQGLIAKVMEGLKRWLFNQEWFRIKFIYPKVRFREGLEEGSDDGWSVEGLEED